ncbi:hypothetical protein [Actinoplanes xinjiangensis]|uniref:hypothetical protein n=1 Tax=Actinoplanes xinjiangensis TaxID=512350 RepID=UPI003425127A
MWVVAELAEDPGAEHNAEAGQAQVAGGVAVAAKVVGQQPLEFGDLDVQDVDQLDLAGHDRGVGRLNRPRPA